jgi:hypothetical protein
LGAVNIAITEPLNVSLRNPILKRYVERFKRTSNSTSDLYWNVWKVIDPAFEKLNSLLYFSLNACCDPEGTIKHGLLSIYVDKELFLSHVFRGQFVYCNST